MSDFTVTIEDPQAFNINLYAEQGPAGIIGSIATDNLVGNISGVSAVPVGLTVSQVRTLLGYIPNSVDVPDGIDILACTASSHISMYTNTLELLATSVKVSAVNFLHNNSQVMTPQVLLNASNKPIPVDADTFWLLDSQSSYASYKTTWANLKATLNTYLTTLFQPLNAFLTTLAAINATIGTGALVRAISPTLTTPDIGAATGTSLILSGNLTTGSQATFGAAGAGRGYYNTSLGLQLPSNLVVGFSSNVDGGAAAYDTNVSRQSAGVVQIGTTAANALGSLACANVTASGTGTFSNGVTVSGSSSQGRIQTAGVDSLYLYSNSGQMYFNDGNSVVRMTSGVFQFGTRSLTQVVGITASGTVTVNSSTQHTFNNGSNQFFLQATGSIIRLGSYNGTGLPLSINDSGGPVLIGTGTAFSGTPRLGIIAESAAQTTLGLKGTASYTGTYFEARDNANTLLYKIDSAGNVTANGTGTHTFGTTNTVTMAAGNLVATGTVTATGMIQTSSDIVFAPSSTITPTVNGQVTIEKTSNTSITFKLKGSDGVVRTGIVTLA